MAQYTKAIVAVLGAVLTSLAVYYGNTTWYPIVTTAVTALSVYVVPNIPAKSATKVDINSAYGQTITPVATPKATDDGWEKLP